MMNNIEKIFTESESCADYARLAELFEKAREGGKRIYFLGNGGSAATSSHFTNDLGKGAGVKGAPPFRAVSLADNVSLITALANDDGYDRIFVAQLENALDKGDVAVGISASGNSPNVVAAIEYANSRGAATVGLTGFSGGR